MTDTTNTEPPLPEPAFSVPTCGLKIRTYTKGQLLAYGDARAAHAVAQRQGEPVTVPSELRAIFDGLEFDAGAGRISAMTLYTRMRDLCLAYAAPPVQQAEHDREADRQRFTDPDFNRWLDESITENGEFTVWHSLKSTQDAYAGFTACLDYISKQAEPQVPTGWSIVRKGEAMCVYHDDIGGYAATEDHENIAVVILYHLARDLLNAAPPAPAAEERAAFDRVVRFLQAVMDEGAEADKAIARTALNLLAADPPAPAVEKTRPGFIPKDASIEVTNWPAAKRRGLTDAQVRRLWNNSPEIHKDAPSFAAFKRIVDLVQSAHGITPADAKDL